MKRHFAACDPVMAALMRAAGPYRLEPQAARSPFESLARAITHQQLNGTAANRILERFIGLCGNGAFPTPAAVLARPDGELRAVGLSFAKIASLKDLAAKAGDGLVPDSATLIALDDGAIVERLTQVRGIGRWTAEMFLIFNLQRPDVYPLDDVGLLRAVLLNYVDSQDPAAMQAGLAQNKAAREHAVRVGERFRPWRSVATWYLWRSLDPVPTEY